MDHSKHELAPGIWLDARRALWLGEPRILAVADLHVGYAWAHRHAGQLMPITARDDTPDRLSALVADYQPERVVLLGDIVHRAVPVQPVKEALRNVLECLPAGVTVTAIAGNHDRHLERLLPGGNCVTPVSHWVTHRCVFVHGDTSSAENSKLAIGEAQRHGGWIIMGHEHPSVTLGDGAATWQRYPCFLVCENVLVLPAFSQWAAGNTRAEFMSPLLQGASVTSRVAILGDRLVPVRRDAI